VTQWSTIRVTLRGRGDVTLSAPPGRLVLVHAEHTLCDLADALDPAFGRWDLDPDHRFAWGNGSASSDPAASEEDSDDVTVGSLGLRPGAELAYTFDLDLEWEHDCEVDEVDVDPQEVAGEEPDEPVCIDGWGVLPDQYERWREEDPLPGESDDEDWDTDWEERSASWEVVDVALAHRPREPDADAAARAVGALRADPDAWPHRLLWASAALLPDNAPDDAVACWTTLAAGLVDPQDEPELPGDADAAAALAALDAADWAGAVIELVREGVGASADPPRLRERILACPEIEGDVSAEDLAVIDRGLRVVVPAWRALGAIDAERRLTRLGAWGLPAALALAWRDAPLPAGP